MKSYLLILIILTVFLRINLFAQNASWEIIPSGTNQNLNSIYFFNHHVGFACGESGVILKSIDSGKTWQSLQSPVVFDLYDCFMFEQECMLAVGDSASGIVTYDSGSTWYVWSLIFGLDMPFYSLDFIDDQGIFNGILGGGLQTILFGVSTSCSAVIVNEYLGNEGGGFYSACMITTQMGVVAGENSISEPILGKTTYLGNDWEIIPIDLNGNKGRATGVSFEDQMNGFISAKVWDGRGAIAKTTDIGDNWTTTFFNNPLRAINFPVSDANQIGYCVGDSGTILKTFDAGESWHYQLSNTSERLNKVFFLDNDFGFVVGDSGTILRTTNGGGVTSIHDDEAAGIDNFGLLQNFPNPFNPTTVISYRLPVSSNVTLKVYDVLGNEIATIVNEYKPAGFYDITFDATGLSSSVYIYQLIAENYIQTRKMVVLK